MELGELIPTNVTPVTIILPFTENVSKFNTINITNATILEVNKTPNTPSINITYPTGGEKFELGFQLINITWEATDLDNDTLNYAVLISSDNGTFSTLEIDYTNTSLTINSTNFVESDEYIIKILATDGINTGNDTTTTFTIAKSDKFYIKNPTGTNVAYFSGLGNIVLAGICTAPADCNAPANSFIIKGANYNTVAYVDSNGNLCIEDSDCGDQDSSCETTRTPDSFIIKNGNDIVSYINKTGGLCLEGTLTENGSP